MYDWVLSTKTIQSILEEMAMEKQGRSYVFDLLSSWYLKFSNESELSEL